MTGNDTRTALHAVAEHVLAAALHRATGRIGLRVTPGGFGTPWFPDGDRRRRVRVEGVELVVEDEHGEVARGPLTTLAATAELVGVPLGAPEGLYTPVTACDPEAPLDPDPAVAATLAQWFAVADDALEAFRGEVAEDDPAALQLWPEHFDLATTAAEVNYGASPGDEHHAEPYLYVGPWSPPEPDGAFWNQPFGASLPAAKVTGPEDALAFFREGRRRAAAG